MFKTDISNLSRHSHAMVEIECSKKVVDKCSGIKKLEYRCAMDNIERNNGEYICLYCSRNIKSSGNKNPNSKYDFDRDFFKEIDNDDKAYLLGWIASDGCVSPNNKICIKIQKNDINCLERLKDIICEDLEIKNTKENEILLQISSKQCVIDICNHLQIIPGKKSDKVRLPKLTEELTWVFLRGYFDGDGNIRNYNLKPTPECSISSNSTGMIDDIKDFVKIPYNLNKSTISFYGTNCIDFLGKIYNNCGKNYLQRKYDLYLSWLTWQPWIKEKGNSKHFPEFKIYKTDINAVIPFKTNNSDVGYDLTIIKEYKKINNYTTLYDTGLKIRVSTGLYAEIIPRSSIIKSGYMLANSIGIIDPNYNGNLLVPLIKIDENSPDIELPFRCCQLIFRQQLHLNIIEVANIEELSTTSREQGGFGSTGN